MNVASERKLARSRTDEPNNSLLKRVSEVKSVKDVLRLVGAIFSRALVSLFTNAIQVTGTAGVAFLALLLLPFILLYFAKTDVEVSLNEESFEDAMRLTRISDNLDTNLSTRLLLKIRRFLGIFKGLSKTVVKTLYKFMVRMVVLPPSALLYLISMLGFSVIDVLFYIVYKRYPTVRDFPALAGTEPNETSPALRKYVTDRVMEMMEAVLKSLGASIITDARGVMDETKKRYEQRFAAYRVARNAKLRPMYPNEELEEAESDDTL